MDKFLVLLLVVVGVVVLVVVNFAGLGSTNIVVLGRGNFSGKMLADYLGRGSSVVLVDVVLNDTLFVGGVGHARLFSVGSTALAGVVLSSVRGFVLEGLESVVVPYGWSVGLMVYNSSDSVVRHVVVKGSNIVIANSRNITLEDCVVVNSTFPAIIVKNSSNIVIRRCVFSNGYAGLLVENSRNVSVYYSNISVSRYLLRVYNSRVLFYGNNVFGSTIIKEVSGDVALCVNGVGNYYNSTSVEYPCMADKPFKVSLTSFTSPLDVKKSLMSIRFIGNIIGVVLLVASALLYVYFRSSSSK